MSKATVVKKESTKKAGGLSKPVQPDGVLSKLLGSNKPLPRTDVIKGLWDKIKATPGMQNGRNINALSEDEWIDFFGKEEITMFELAKCISNHLVK